MSVDLEMLIAGNKKVKDWITLKEKIKCDFENEKLWEKAYNLFYLRISTRYLKPICYIKCNDSQTGEGFAIITILCAMIEFLETTWLGINFEKGKSTFIIHSVINNAV